MSRPNRRRHWPFVISRRFRLLQPFPRQALRTKTALYFPVGMRLALVRSQLRGVPGVLKITRRPRRGRIVSIKLEGELLQSWVDSVRDACRIGGRRPRILRLDLAAVRYADAAGTQLLHDLIRAGAEITECSGFIRELLQAERA